MSQIEEDGTGHLEPINVKWIYECEIKSQCEPKSFTLVSIIGRS